MVRASLAVLWISSACRPEPTPLPFTSSIDAVPPYSTHGTVRWGTSDEGGLVLEVSVRGPVDEISRERGSGIEPNLIWHLVQGACAAWIRQDPGLKVLARWTRTPTSRETNDFRYVITRSDAGDPMRPRALAAFGRPLYACGDLLAG